MLSVRAMDAAYGRAQVLFDVGFDVARGEVVALLGRNGAGKSTTLRRIMGLLPGARGEIELAGRSIEGLAPHRIARLGVGYVPEERRIFRDLTVLENLEVGRQPPRGELPEWTPGALFDLFPNLAEARSRRGGLLSGGEQQMLTVARTLMGNPSVVLLDEPSEGIAPRIVDEMASTVVALKRRGLSVLLSEQNLRFARRVCDRAYIMEKGRIRFGGTLAELDADEDVRRQYLSV